MARNRVAEHLRPPPGVRIASYPPGRDRVYRVALWVLAASLGAMAGASAAGAGAVAQGATAGAALANLVAAWTFLVWLPSWRWVVRGLALLALGGLVAGVPLLVWAGVLAASAVMAAKEHHCFHFRGARWIPWVSLAAGIDYVLHATPALALLIAGLAVLWAVMLWDREKLPLLSVRGNLAEAGESASMGKMRALDDDGSGASEEGDHEPL